MDYSLLYNTTLSPEQEALFQQAMSDRMRDLYDYDLRGAFSQGALLQPGHLPDTFKKPNHPTFSAESMYSAPGMQGGQWAQGAFSPGYNTYSNEDLQRYFQQNEPGVTLALPPLR